MSDRTGVLVPFPMSGGPGASAALDPLRRSLFDDGPVLLPFPASQAAPTLPENPVVPPGAAVAVATSGSTGSPKRAVLTRAALLASAHATHRRLAGPGQWLLALPPYHIAGLQVLVRSVVAGIPPVVLPSATRFTVADFVAASARLTRDAPRFTALVPTQLVRLLEVPHGATALAAFDAVLVGGDTTDSQLLRAAQARDIPVVTTYGMSETAGGCVYDGQPLAEVLVQLHQENCDSPSQVRLAGPVLASGYLADPDRTAQRFTADRCGTMWFNTDDVGHLDECGRLVVDGRVDDVIITGGVKVWPSEVEQELTAVLPPGSQCVVVGIPDPQWGHLVTVAISVPAGVPIPTVDYCRRSLRDRLPAPALPRLVQVIPTLPVRESGKVDRDRVRATLMTRWSRQGDEEGGWR